MERTEKAQALYSQAFEFLADENYAKAIAGFTEVIKLHPNDVQSYSQRGDCYMLSDQLEKALEDYSKAVSLEPKVGYVYENRAKLYIRLGENEKAKADFDKVVELNPKFAGNKYYEFGELVEKLTGNKREAAKYLKKSIESGGDYVNMAKRLLAQWGM
jgi:tetratricopeptide (TPR) repeat protein